jgi:N-6 DNA Methylase
MTGIRNREEAVNTQLALVISKLGVTADAETILVHGRHRPDVLFELRGLRVVIEGKFDDHANSKEAVLIDARKRVGSGIAHIAVAVVYPLALRTTRTTKIFEVLHDAKLKYRIIAETNEFDGWLEGPPAEIMESLRRAQESLVKDDIVEKTAKSLSIYLDSISKLWMGQHGACDRLCKHLQMPIPAREEKDAANERRETAAKVSALILANAFIFQEQLSRSHEEVDSLAKLKKRGKLVAATAEHWEWIWRNINYVPIFQLGGKILDELPASPSTTQNIESLLDEAHSICAQQAALRHDLMGRIYHWLLHHAKYLGTYYTSVPAATLLLKIAMDLDWKVDFADMKSVAEFKVADLACGTGTLLMAAAQALTDNFIKARADNDKGIGEKDLANLHRTLMQNSLHGYDILPSAVHLTASTLALLAPEVAFRQMNLYAMPIGMSRNTPRLGSLDFLKNAEVQTQFALDDTHLETQRTGAARTTYANATVPKLNLCVMNPPFVSSRYGNLLFGSLPEERAMLQKELKSLAKDAAVSATAGLGAVFVPLGDKNLVEGGRLAFVLPIALATGEAWSHVRGLLAAKYHLEVVITSHDPDRTNFSENTDLSELLFIARKRKQKEKAGLTVYAGLRRNPTTIHEALDLASRLSSAVKELLKRQSQTTIKQGDRTLCNLSSLPAPVGDENWTSAIISQSYLAQIHFELSRYSTLKLPGGPNRYPLNLCRLDQLGTIGYDIRDITDAFEVERGTQNWTPYSGFWDHDAKRVTQIAQQPNAFLTVRTEPLEGRKLKSAEAVWSRSGRILLVSRLWPITHKILACGLETQALGNTWWAFDESRLNPSESKALLLWLNSSLGVLMYFGKRAVTRSAWMQMKKPAWESMPVIDVRQLPGQVLRTLADKYDELSVQGLMPLAQVHADRVRIAIDNAISEGLGLPELQTVRELLVREPGLTGSAYVSTA